MTHPEELLAGYVDGTLPMKDRAAVDAHLAGCARCRRDVSLAVSARSGLRTLPEIPAPEGVATLALEEARSAGPARDGRPPRWYRIAGVATAAAAALLVLTLTLPHIGQGASSGDTDRKVSAGAGAEQGGPRAPLGATGIEIQHRNYDNDSLTALSGSYARDAAAVGSAPAPSTPGTEFASAQSAQKQTSDALACVHASVPDATGTLIRLIRARFEGTPAYLALFIDGPGAGQPADRVNVWVFATNDCSILSFSYAKL